MLSASLNITFLSFFLSNSLSVCIYVCLLVESTCTKPWTHTYTHTLTHTHTHTYTHTHIHTHTYTHPYTHTHTHTYTYTQVNAWHQYTNALTSLDYIYEVVKIVNGSLGLINYIKWCHKYIKSTRFRRLLSITYK